MLMFLCFADQQDFFWYNPKLNLEQYSVHEKIRTWLNCEMQSPVRKPYWIEITTKKIYALFVIIIINALEQKKPISDTGGNVNK